MLLTLALLLPLAQAEPIRDLGEAVVTHSKILQVGPAPARPLDRMSSSLWASGASVEVLDDGLLLDGDLLVRFAEWGRGRVVEEVDAAESFLACAPTPRAGADCVVGPTWAHTGVDVWWAELDAGLELGWTVYEPPPGVGPLVLGLSVDGALALRADGEGAQLVSVSRRIWTLSEAVAWDADGVQLPATLHATPAGLQVVVDDTVAHYPITVDPTLTTARATLTAAGAGQFGVALTAADLNFDGADDLAVGDPVTGTVRVYLTDRLLGGISTNAMYTYAGTGEFGASLDTGDINGDGIDDLLIGSHGPEFAVVLGNRFAAPGITPLTLPNGADVSLSVTTGADFDNDGRDDAMINDSTGVSHICSGRNVTPYLSCTHFIAGPINYARLSAAPDLDGDGYGDVVIGDWLHQTLYFVFGSPAGLGQLISITAAGIPGLTNTSMFAYRLDAHGDLDHSGRSDVAVANMLGNQVALLTNITRGSYASVVLNNNLAVDFGSAIEVADLNGDAYDDLAVGMRDAHAVAVFPGVPGSLVNPAGMFDYNDTLGSSTFGDESVAMLNDNNRGAGLIAIGSYSTNQVRVFDGWRDEDGDGYGPDDCIDTDPAVHPGVTDIPGNGVDEDCSGRLSCYLDVDADGYRATTTGDAPQFFSCSTLGFATANAAVDCNDNNAAVFPGATETTADGVDGNCDGSEVCYLDGDRDGRRSTTTGTTTTLSCTAAGFALATAAVDCNDANSAAYPGAPEVSANGVDEDCDGTETCYTDMDGDGARTTTTVAGVVPPTCAGVQQGLATDLIDCDDARAGIRPGVADFVGDGIDSNCDGRETCWADFDHDGHRSTTATIQGTDTTCSGGGTALTSAPHDCYDGDATIYVGAPELVGNQVDNDCDGSEICYQDLDDDGARTALTATVAGTSCGGAQLATDTDPLDCDDAAPTVRPGATEATADGVDSDCDGTEIRFVDADQDGTRSTATRSSTSVTCAEADLGTAADLVDCDDSNASTWPGAPEFPGDRVDSDCDALELCYRDADTDGARTEDTVISGSVSCSDLDLGVAADPLDCNDLDPAYSDVCPVFYLRQSGPPAAGAPTTVHTDGAVPFSRVILVGGRPGATTVPCGAELDLTGVRVLGSATADAAGVATFTVTPPATLAGRTVVVQAAMPARCEVSNSLVWSL